MEYDFWYSEKQKNVIDIQFDRLPMHTSIHGKEYTECAEHSKGLKSNWDDAIFLGTFQFHDIVVRRL